MKLWPLVSFVMTFASKPEAKAKLFFFPSKELEIIELKAFAPKFMSLFYQKIREEKVFSCRPNILRDKPLSQKEIFMNDLLSMKLDLIRFELLTIKQMRRKFANCDKKSSVIFERIQELEELIEKIKNQRGALK